MVLVGHPKQLQFLETAQKSGRMGHAFIFSGPEKIGKKTAALEWISRIIGTRVFEASAHPDFLFLAPLVDLKTGQKNSEITVGQAREFIRKLSLKPSFGKYKTALIDDAHLMNDEAQNALLKTLEEPSGDALIILVVSDPRRLLETIRSRCQILKFNFVPHAGLEGFGRQYAVDNKLKLDNAPIKEVAALSFGRPGRLVDFLVQPELAEIWRKRAKEFAAIVGAELPEKFAYAKKITDDETANINEIMEIWQFLFRNLLRQALDQSAGVEPLLASSRQGSDPCKIADILKKIHELSVILQTTNASPRLAIENFMMEI